MSTQDLPTPETLRKLLRYEPDTGNLFWRVRTPDMFTDGKYSADRTCRSFNTQFAGREALTANLGGYRQGRIFDRPVLAHRVIWCMVKGEWPPDQIDHINGVRHDNRLSNLRSVTSQENARNKALPCNNTSGVCGVRWYDSRGKWIAEIYYNNKQFHLGWFTEKADAIAARAAAEIKYGFHTNHGREAS